MKAYLTYCFLLFIPIFGMSQAEHQVEHTSGTQTINGVEVTVTSRGAVDVNTSYCEDSKPYHIGGDYVEEGDGSYYFEFKPAVSEVMLNFSALSASDSYGEEVIIHVNGEHYKVPEAGEKNSCDDLAIITDEGNIAPCVGCVGAGFVGLVIKGPIERIQLTDTILFGAPAGTLFSLFIGEPTVKHKEIKSVRALRVLKIADDPDHVKVIGIPSKTANLTVFDENGNEVVKMAQEVTNGQKIDVRKLQKGYYIFVLKSEGFREERSIVLE